MLSLMRFGPENHCRIFLKMRDASSTLTSGLRNPMEFTQRTRFDRDKTFMTWCLLVGSASQSFAKQTMFRPVITAPDVGVGTPIPATPARDTSATDIPAPRGYWRGSRIRATF